MTAVRFRPATPDDADAVARLLAGLSPATAYARFQTALGPVPSGALVRALLPDGVRGGALLAYAGEEPVAHGMWARLGATRVAEIGLVVADGHQQQGLGSLLARALVDDLRAHGIDRVEVFSGTGNQAVTRMVARDAPHAERSRDGAMVGYTFHVEPRAERPGAPGARGATAA